MIIILGGLPGSGKSTLAKHIAIEHGYKLFSADQYRKSIFNCDHESEVTSYTVVIQPNGKVESYDLYRVDDKFLSVLTRGFWSYFTGEVYDYIRETLHPRILIDATNLRLHNIKRWIEIAHDDDEEVFYVYMKVSVDEAIKRNNGRTRVVPEDVIRGMDKYMDIEEIQGAVDNYYEFDTEMLDMEEIRQEMDETFSIMSL